MAAIYTCMNECAVVLQGVTGGKFPSSLSSAVLHVYAHHDHGRMPQKQHFFFRQSAGNNAQNFVSVCQLSMYMCACVCVCACACAYVCM
jgi:hypothetical protein